MPDPKLEVLSPQNSQLIIDQQPQMAFGVQSMDRQALKNNVKEHAGAYGMGVHYAYTMVHKAPQRTATPHESLAPVPAR